MKTIYLLRHAEAEKRSDLSDIERPLTGLGALEVLNLSKKLQNENMSFDLVLCSPAKRTRETCQLFLENSSINNSFTVDELLYNSVIENFLQIVKGLNKDVGSILIVSHNPTISEFANFLLKPSESQLSFGTASLAKLELNIDSWDKICKDCARTIWFI